MKNIVNIVKNTHWLYSMYFYIGSVLISMIKLFVNIDPKRILIISYGGKKLDDSPYVIYNMMCQDSRFDEFKIVWALNNPENYTLPRGEAIKTDTLKYYYYALKAAIWISNSSVERGLSFKQKDTFYFNTWHGTPMKLMGNDIVGSKSFSTLAKPNVNIMLAQGRYDADILSSTLNIPRRQFSIIGLPRNDIFSSILSSADLELKGLNIPVDKKVILYAPTFREYLRDENKNCIITPPIDFKIWKEQIGDEYIILFRAHYEVAKVLNVISDGFVYDVSSYEPLIDLMIVSDYLISDYSSIFFDYAITKKPMFCFAYDYEEYKKERGLYLDLKEEFPLSFSQHESELLNQIINCDKQLLRTQTIDFRDRYVEEYGNAAKQSLDIIYNNVK